MKVCDCNIKRNFDEFSTFRIPMENENPASNENQKTEFSNETMVQDDKGISEDDMKKEPIDEGSENKENVVSDDVETKEVAGEEAKAEGAEVKKEEDSVKKEDDSKEIEENKEDEKSKNADAEWDKNVLFVSGMPPVEAGVSVSASISYE